VLPDGDTLRILRADQRFSRVAVPIDDDAPYVDLDTEAEFRAAEARSPRPGNADSAC